MMEAKDNYKHHPRMERKHRSRCDYWGILEKPVTLETSSLTKFVK
jgi:hypothetical protein